MRDDYEMIDGIQSESNRVIGSVFRYAYPEFHEAERGASGVERRSGPPARALDSRAEWLLAHRVIGQQPDLYSTILRAAFERGVVGDRPALAEPEDVHAKHGNAVPLPEVPAHGFRPRLAQPVIVGGIAVRGSEAFDLQEEPVSVSYLARYLVERGHGFGRELGAADLE